MHHVHCMNYVLIIGSFTGSDSDVRDFLFFFFGPLHKEFPISGIQVGVHVIGSIFPLCGKTNLYIGGVSLKYLQVDRIDV